MRGTFGGGAGAFYLAQHLVRPFDTGFADARDSARVQLTARHGQLQCPRSVYLVTPERGIVVKLVPVVNFLQPLRNGVKVVPDGDEFRSSHSQLATKVMSEFMLSSNVKFSPSSFQPTKDTPLLVGFAGLTALPPGRTIWEGTSEPPSESNSTV